ncbi:hypothetical protein PHSC3_000926 [Chlamydiales bacterium STE3]|nr:hypothetical protein PHSC3_000926 [Chlamydiales bacterium STE3]
MNRSARLLIALLIIITCIVLAFVGKAVYGVHRFNRLKESAPLESISWTVKPESDERYRLFAIYHFKVDDQQYQGTTLLSGAPFRNAWAAEQAKKELAPQYRTVWYDPADPHFSSIEKNFPTKNVAYAAILFALLNYFVWGGYFYTKYWLKSHGLEDYDRTKK